jgi:predicted CoA-binding protein/GNAT superfamily N-acetyltransferase
LTARGQVIRLRPVGPADADPLLALHERTSSRSRYLRFFNGAPAFGGEIDRLTRPADGKHLALLAEDAGRVVGVASYELIDPDRAEFAVLVDDERHGEGIGTLLLEQLAAAARRAGVAELIGSVLPDNAAMLRVSRDLAPGVPRTANREEGVMEVRVPTTPDEAALAAVSARDRTAEHWSLRPLMAPTSVAVVGAGRRPGGIGHEVLRALLAGGYTGPVYPVNPHATEIAGRTAYPSVRAIGAPVDLAVVAVPASAVRDVVADCAATGVGGAVILSSGLAETGRPVQRRRPRSSGWPARTACAWSARTASAWSTPTPRCGSARRSHRRCPRPVGWPSRPSRGRSGWRSWNRPRAPGPGCPRSCRWATRPT